MGLNSRIYIESVVLDPVGGIWVGRCDSDRGIAEGAFSSTSSQPYFETHTVEFVFTVQSSNACAFVQTNRTGKIFVDGLVSYHTSANYYSDLAEV